MKVVKYSDAYTGSHYVVCYDKNNESTVTHFHDKGTGYTKCTEVNATILTFMTRVYTGYARFRVVCTRATTRTTKVTHA